MEWKGAKQLEWNWIGISVNDVIAMRNAKERKGKEWGENKNANGKEKKG